LRRMARRTSRASFRALVAEARAAIPGLNLSTDLIVGFPGEGEAEFTESLDFVAEMAFARLHVFPYSSRPGTAAARMPGHVPKQEKKARAARMMALGDALSLAFHRRHEEQTAAVLWETAVGANGAGLKWVGYTANYIRVHAAGPAELGNRVTPVRLHGARPDGMDGEIVGEG
ncbi:MAG: hypothetical protein KC425_26110, partial [Anaerolineales bacterium]|nr:hypothetical protein [Anaerolineales bacterium]